MKTKRNKMRKNKTKIALNINEIKKKLKMVGCCTGAKKNFKLGQEIAESSMEKLWELANTAENEEEAVYDLLNMFAGFLSLSMIYVSTFKDILDEDYYNEVNLEDEFDLDNAEFQKAKKIDGEK